MKQEVRMERKYWLPPSVLIKDVEGLVLRNFAGFKEVYWQRTVNNVYFDTPSLDFYYDNLDGVPLKHKVRIRWYDDNLDTAALEIKSKDGYATYKHSFKLPRDFLLIKAWQGLDRYIDSKLIDGLVVEKCRNLIPSLKNSYTRRYFISADGKLRLTLDTNIMYEKPEFKSRPKNRLGETHNVLEIKYHQRDQEKLSEVLKNMPYRFNKFSKYARGIEALYE